MLAVRDPEIKYKNKTTSTEKVIYITNVTNNIKQQETSAKENISNLNNLNSNKNELNNNIISEANFVKGNFEHLFAIKSEKQKLQFIQNYKLGKVEELIDSKIKFPENHMIIVINTKKALLELAGERLAKASKMGSSEYDFSKSLFKRMWDIIIKFSQNLRKANSAKNAKGNNSLKNQIINSNSNSDQEIFESIKIFSLNRNLEYLGFLTEPLTEEIAEKFYSPLLRKCLSFSAEVQECDLSHCISQLLSAMQFNRSLFPENFNTQESNFYIDDFALPAKTKFYRVLFFNGAVTELINIPALENKLVTIKSKFNIVFNFFLFEHDFQFEKKIYPLLINNNMIDYKIKDFEIFLKQENFEEELQQFHSFIGDLHQKANKIEKQMKGAFEAFAQAKNLFFENPDFLEYQKKYDAEHSKFMQDYEIICKNNSKFFEFSKANVNKTQIDYIKKFFAEMLNKNVIESLLQNVKGAVDFQRFQLLLDRMIEEANTVFDVLIKNLNNLLISLNDLGNKIILILIILIFLNCIV
jgi:hypothetical protein